MLLNCYNRNLKALPNGLVLEPHFSKIIKNKPKAVCSNDFELLKVIGKGGFSKVYMGNLFNFSNKYNSKEEGYRIHLCNEGNEKELGNE